VITLPAKFKIENAKPDPTPAVLVAIATDILSDKQSSQTDWQNNTQESNVDYATRAADVILSKVAGGDAWVQKTSGATARESHSAVIYNGEMYVFGGKDVTGYKNDIWRYSISGDSWTQLTPTGGPPVVRSGHSSIIYNGKMYVFGGVNALGRLNDVWEYDIVGNSWTQLTPTGGPPDARASHSAVIYSGKMYVFGGLSATTRFNDVWEFDISGNSWTQKTSGATAREFHSAVIYNGKMYVFGGLSGPALLNDVWEYGIVNDFWREVAENGSTPLTPRGGHTACVNAHKMYVYAGHGITDDKNDIWEYNLISNGWAQLSTGTLTLRAHHTAAISSGNIYVFGGLSGTTFLNDVWEYTTETYNTSGYIRTQNMDVGQTPTVNGEWILEYKVSLNCTIFFEAWASDTGAFAGEETSIGTIVDGDTITVLERYYRIRTTLNADTSGFYSPFLNSIQAEFVEAWQKYSDRINLDYEPAVKGISSLTTAIDDFNPATISQLSIRLAFTKSVSNFLYSKYPKNKPVKIYAGFKADGFTESDYVQYGAGQIDNWKITADDEVILTLQDYKKEWDVNVPEKWEDVSDDYVWYEEHPVDVMQNIITNHINVRDSKINISSFATVKAALSGWKVSRVITGEPVSAEKLLEELRLLTGSYFIPQADGKITLKLWDSAEAAVETLTDDNVKKFGGWDANAASLVNQTNIYFGWDGDGDDAEDYGELKIDLDLTSQKNWLEKALQDSRDKWTRASESAQITTLAGNIRNRYKNPPPMIAVTLDRRMIHLETADMVNVTTRRAPSIDMSGITNEKYQIVKRDLNIKKDTIKLQLLKV